MIKRSWPVFVPLVLFTLLAVALGIMLAKGEHNKFALHISEQAPVTQLPAPGGKGAGFATSSWHGKPYLINFFASWCAPCRAENDALLELAHAQHIPIIGIACKDKPQAVAAFLAKQGNPYKTVAADADGHAAIDWGLTGIPESFLIDADGVIRLHADEPLTDAFINQELLPLWQGLAP